MEAQSGRSNEIVVLSVGSLCSLKAELRDACLSMPHSYCIFKTPTILFRHKKTSFLPNCFSIGPMHHGEQHLLATEKIKVKYLKALLSRMIRSRYPPMSKQSKEVEEQNVLSDLINAVEMIKEQASSYYAGSDFAAELGDEFVKTMLLDGVFIIELFRKDAEVVIKEQDDPIFSMSCMLQYLNHDLMLLENQIPWLVLDNLFKETRLPCETKSLIELALMFFANTFTSHPPQINPSRFKDQDIKHILDLLRSSLVLPFQETVKKNESSWMPIRSITRLKEAGVTFEKAVPVPDSVLDIRFRDGCLTIPSLLIQETTETIFRNLIAYEQCLPNCQPIFTCYAKLLDNLIDTTNDMEILCKRDIFDNWLSPDDATQFFNNLYNDTFVKEFYYSELSNKLDCHCKRIWPRWRAYYAQTYLLKPWAIAAQIYAVVILVLTVWQTFI